MVKCEMEMCCLHKKACSLISLAQGADGAVKAVFHFNRIVAKRSVFHCFMITLVELMTCTQWNTLRFGTIWLKWKTGVMCICVF